MYHDDVMDVARRIVAISRRWNKAPGDVLQDSFGCVGEVMKTDTQRRLFEWETIDTDK